MGKIKQIFWAIFGPRYWITEEDVLIALSQMKIESDLPADPVFLALKIFENRNITVKDVHNWQYWNVLSKGVKKELWLESDRLNRLNGKIYTQFVLKND